MTLTLHTEGWFDAAHHLANYEGACANLHGHTYKVEIWVRGEEKDLNEAGILWDFENLKGVLKKLDHPKEGELNNILGENPTAERLSIYIYRIFAMNMSYMHLKFKVRVYEQIEPKRSWCECGYLD